MILNELHEQKKINSVVFSFARMQPPTIGHARLINRIIETAKNESADHMLFLSQTRNSEHDPLSWDDKARIVKAAFPGLKISEDLSIRTPFAALKHLAETYDNIVLVVGQDRVNEFKKMSNYQDEWGFKSFNIVEAGRRDTSNEIEGVSSTLARQYATDNNFDLFRTVLPETLSEEYVHDIFNKVRTGMNLVEGDIN